MPPKQDLSADQIAMLVEVIKRTQATITSADWEDISTVVGSTNGRAAKERFRYLLVQLKNKAANGDDVAVPKTPKLPKAMKRPASKNRATDGAKGKMAKKVKAKQVVEEDEDKAVTPEEDADVDER